MESMTDESEPSYTVVNKQLQDVVRFQHTVIARMKAKVRNSESKCPILLDKAVHYNHTFGQAFKDIFRKGTYMYRVKQR